MPVNVCDDFIPESLNMRAITYAVPHISQKGLHLGWAVIQSRLCEAGELLKL